MCPGQDTRFWRPGDIFDVTCARCGRKVEFFKDDATRLCRCGNRIRNPKLSMGCAQWCEHAKECLGFDPKEELQESTEEIALADEIIAALRDEFGDESNIFQEAIQSLQNAERMLRTESANPRVVISAVLLSEVDERSEPAAGSADEENLTRARKIMSAVDLDKSTTDEVCDLIERYRKGDDEDTPDLKILRKSRVRQNN
jgi:hypothetical protein